MIWSGALMLQFLGHQQAHDAIVRAIEITLKQGPLTPDLGGTATTAQLGAAIEEIVLNHPSP
jgi:tartrate dehydrogenase/decarboxylase/D-malate dehydrogenase